MKIDVWIVDAKEGETVYTSNANIKIYHNNNIKVEKINYGIALCMMLNLAVRRM